MERSKYMNIYDWLSIIALLSMIASFLMGRYYEQCQSLGRSSQELIETEEEARQRDIMTIVEKDMKQLDIEYRKFIDDEHKPEIANYLIGFDD